MDDSMKRDVEAAMQQADVVAAAEHGRDAGASAAMFITVTKAGGFTFDEALQIYGTYVEACASGSHCHGDESETEA